MKLALTAILLISLYCTSDSEAQDSKTLIDLTMGVDLQLAPSELQDFWNTGGGSNLGFSRYVSENVAINLNLALNRFSIDKAPVEEYISGELPPDLDYLVNFLNFDNGDVTVIAVRLGASKDIPLRAGWFENTREGSTLFYVRGGAGVAYNTINDFELGLLGKSKFREGVSKIGATVEGGLGFRFYMTNRLGLSAESTIIATFLGGNTMIYIPFRFGFFMR